MKETKQLKTWKTKFGKEYTDRNMMSPEEANQLPAKNYGISRIALNREFLGGFDVNRFLEVGCNIGNQLLLFQKIGYTDLWGIEPQDYALEIAKKRTKDINLVKASAFDIPFKDNYFDVVFTSGVLTHISPKDIEKAIDEMHRCSRKYILGLEPYHPKDYQMVNYRGNDNLLWKTNFPKLFLDKFQDLKLVHQKILKRKSDDNLDVMYLLEKKETL